MLTEQEEINLTILDLFKTRYPVNLPSPEFKRILQEPFFQDMFEHELKNHFEHLCNLGLISIQPMGQHSDYKLLPKSERYIDGLKAKKEQYEREVADATHIKSRQAALTESQISTNSAVEKLSKYQTPSIYPTLIITLLAAVGTILAAWVAWKQFNWQKEQTKTIELRDSSISKMSREIEALKKQINNTHAPYPADNSEKQ